MIPKFRWRFKSLRAVFTNLITQVLHFSLKGKWAPELIEKTISVFQPYSKSKLTDADAIEILDTLQNSHAYFNAVALAPVNLEAVDLRESKKESEAQ